MREVSRDALVILETTSEDMMLIIAIGIKLIYHNRKSAGGDPSGFGN
jgi:hypothetical protein